MAVRELVTFFIVSAILVCCESGFVDTLPRCRARDYECHKNVMQSVIRNIGTTGIHDIDINRVDPLDLTGLQIYVNDLIDFTITKGEAKGVKSCTVSKFVADFTKTHVSGEIICDILATGAYRVSTYNPLIKIFLGIEALHGEGRGYVKIDKLRVAFDYPFELVKRSNDWYVSGLLGLTNYTFDVLDNVQFHAEGGTEEDKSSQLLVRILNENWKLVMDYVWRHIRDIGSGYIYDFSAKFFNNVPVRYFVIDDVTDICNL